jgi:peptide chain release factor 1
MITKLEALEKRYTEIASLLCLPETAADVETCTRLLKEQKQLSPVAIKFREYKAHLAAVQDAKDLMADAGGDAALKAMLAEEAEAAKAAAEEDLQALKILLLPRDENDDKNVIVELRAGAGGEESALFAGDLFRMYSMYAESRGWKPELLYTNETGLGGFKEISFMINGDGAFSRFKFESGVHRVQRIPVTESNGKIQTSTVTVAVLPEAEEVDIQINPADLQIDTFRSSGAGGQHINKTESAIRITHLPTGLVVECQDERSQYKNKDKAMKVLRSRLKQMETQRQQASLSDQRKAQVGTGDRSEKIRTYNFPQSRVTDHRIGLTLYKLDAILNGALDELIDALITHDTAEKLKNLSESQ